MRVGEVSWARGEVEDLFAASVEGEDEGLFEESVEGEDEDLSEGLP